VVAYRIAEVLEDSQLEGSHEEAFCLSSDTSGIPLMADEPKQNVAEPVQAEPFNFTKFTGWSSAAGTVVVAAYASVKAIIHEVPDPLIGLGLLLLVGFFFLAAAIAAGTDVLARAYVTARTTPDPKDDTKVLPASLVLAQAMEKHSEEAKIVAVPRIKGVKVQGKSATLLALKITGEKTEFQALRDGQTEPEWVAPVAVEFPKAKK
jgi:hypothetical protein